MPKGEERLANTQETVPVPTTGALATPGELTPEIVEKAQKFAALSRDLRLAALRATTEKDWVDLDGSPYLMASGCHRIASLFRIRTRNVRTERVEEPNAEYTIVVTGEACSELLDPGGWVEIVGTASSTDRFLTKGGRAKAAFGDVLKKAHTSFMGRAIRQLVGLSGLSWDELATLGIHREKAARVEYAKPAIEQSDHAWVQVAFRDKDRLRDLVRAKAGVSPMWDGAKKAWKIPRKAAEDPEIRALLIGQDQQEEQKSVDENLFQGDDNENV
ncbi:MAG: hypothetical protein QXW98_04970 [Candidatus Caldarchaeum sp.]